MRDQTILITGSRGLIGTLLTTKLVSLGFKVQGFDCAYPLDHPAYGTIHDGVLFEERLKHCHGVIHLAAVSRVITAEQNPALCWQTNAEATRKLLELTFHASHKPWFLYASSREVYGQQTTLPVSETAVLSPINVYARSKVAAEQAVADYRWKGLQTAILRFSNVYGSVDDYPDRVIPAFCRAAAFGTPIRIDGSDNLFDFSHVEDVVRGIIRVIQLLEAGFLDLPTIHLTTGHGTTLREAAELARKNAYAPIDLIEAPARSFDVHAFCGDPSLADQLLDWKTQIDLETGMQQFIQAFRETMPSPQTDRLHALMPAMA